MAICFGAIFFQNQDDVEPLSTKGYKQDKEAKDVFQMEILKSDLVTEDLIAYYEELFDVENAADKLNSPSSAFFMSEKAGIDITSVQEHQFITSFDESDGDGARQDLSPNQKKDSETSENSQPTNIIGESIIKSMPKEHQNSNASVSFEEFSEIEGLSGNEASRTFSSASNAGKPNDEMPLSCSVGGKTPGREKTDLKMERTESILKNESCDELKGN